MLMHNDMILEMDAVAHSPRGNIEKWNEITTLILFSFEITLGFCFRLVFQQTYRHGLPCPHS